MLHTLNDRTHRRRLDMLRRDVFTYDPRPAASAGWRDTSDTSTVGRPPTTTAPPQYRPRTPRSRRRRSPTDAGAGQAFPRAPRARPRRPVRVEGEAVVDGAGDGPFTGVVRLTLGTAAGEVTVSLDTDDAQALADRLATAAIDARTCAERRNDDY